MAAVVANLKLTRSHSDPNRREDMGLLVLTVEHWQYIYIVSTFIDVSIFDP